ncbi:hypothetical protein [Pseudofrankia asymbiotica]|nr:hypothetical protein [Pseudofrankia asymbiotica]
MSTDDAVPRKLIVASGAPPCVYSRLVPWMDLAFAGLLVAVRR